MLMKFYSPLAYILKEKVIFWDKSKSKKLQNGVKKSLMKVLETKAQQSDRLVLTTKQDQIKIHWTFTEGPDRNAKNVKRK